MIRWEVGVKLDLRWEATAEGRYLFVGGLGHSVGSMTKRRKMWGGRATLPGCDMPSTLYLPEDEMRQRIESSVTAWFETAMETS